MIFDVNSEDYYIIPHGGTSPRYHHLSNKGVRWLFHLRGLFKQHHHADTWALILRHRGNYARIRKLSQTYRRLYGEDFEWGVWVREIHPGTVN